MNTITFGNIREHFTEVSDEVRFGKKSYVITKNNKPALGMVPIESLMLLFDILEKAESSSEIAEITNKYAAVLDSKEFRELSDMLKNPPKASNRMKASIRAAKNKFNN